MEFTYSVFERRRGDVLVSNDRRLLDLGAVHRMLQGSYWAAGIPRAVVARAVAGSMAYGVYRTSAEAPGAPAGPGALVQIGLARVITDGATFAYLADVWIEPEHRGHGHGRFLVETVLAHPELQTLRRWMLVTRDAHSVYTPFGFLPVDDAAAFPSSRPGNIMVRRGQATYGVATQGAAAADGACGLVPPAVPT